MTSRRATTSPAAEPRTWEPFRRVGEIADRGVPRVSPFAPASQSEAILRNAGATAALAVSADGTPLGVVTAARLALLSSDDQTFVAVTPLGAVLHESVPISVAVALMASLPADAVAIVSDNRQAVGLLCARDVMRWVAREAGHTVAPGGVTGT